jgi:hypothetical protein
MEIALNNPITLLPVNKHGTPFQPWDSKGSVWCFFKRFPWSEEKAPEKWALLFLWMVLPLHVVLGCVAEQRCKYH